MVGCVSRKNETCESRESSCGRWAPTSTCGQDHRGKSTMLHFEDTLFVCSPLLAFMSSVASVGGGCTIRCCMGVEDSDIKEGRLFAFVSEILGLDVESCAFLSIGASEGESLFSQWLESGFGTASVQPQYGLNTASVQPQYSLSTASVQPQYTSVQPHYSLSTLQYSLTTASAQPQYSLCTPSVQLGLLSMHMHFQHRKGGKGSGECRVGQQRRSGPAATTFTFHIVTTVIVTT